MNSSFSPTLPTLQLAWDSTSLGLFKECPRKYYYSIILSYTHKKENVHLKFGQLYHSALETYDHKRTQGASHEEAVRASARFCLESTVVRGDGWWRPWNSDDPNKNRLTLLRTVVWYLDQFADDPLKTLILANGKPAVELSFRFDLDFSFESTGEQALLCGHLDRVVSFGDDYWVLDRKTSKNSLEGFFEKFSPDNQMTTYTIAAQVVFDFPVKGIIIDGAQIGATFSRFKRGFTFRHPTELEEWMRETKIYLSLAETYALDNFWPKNDKSCGNYGGCPFREICSKAPSLREEWMENAYAKRTWDPLQVRGDI